MAKTILRSNHHDKAFHVLGLFSLLLLIPKSGAYEFAVGGSKGWTVASDSNALNYNQWAETKRFQIGDTLLFVYPANNDSVLHVDKEDYNNCNTATCLEKYSDGHTVFKLQQSGHYYFISGVEDNCHKNEKMVLVVMADRRNNQSSDSNQTSVALSPPPSESPAPAPTDEESPNSPPWGSVEIVPAPAPATEQTPPPPPPPPSGASSIVLLSSSICSIGALELLVHLFF